MQIAHGTILHPKFAIRLLNARGVSIIAAIFILVILAFMGVMFVSLISTGSFTAINDMQSAQALYVAEAGVEYEQRVLARNLIWYRGPDPLDALTQTLGAGSFSAAVSIPATELRGGKLLAGGNIANVQTTNRFPSSGYLQIEDDVTANAEFVRYTGITSSFPYQFTGLTRAQLGSAAVDHPNRSNVYPVALLTSGFAASCSPLVSITASANAKFLSSGTINILGEDIAYAGVTFAGGNMTFTGLQRCMSGSGPVAANAGDPVTPILDGVSAVANVESEITSTATVGAASRTIKKTVTR
jgi:hypothetical protein